MELEKNDAIDTLERHKKTLLEFAEKNNYFLIVMCWYLFVF